MKEMGQTIELTETDFDFISLIASHYITIQQYFADYWELYEEVVNGNNNLLEKVDDLDISKTPNKIILNIAVFLIANTLPKEEQIKVVQIHVEDDFLKNLSREQSTLPFSEACAIICKVRDLSNSKTTTTEAIDLLMGGYPELKPIIYNLAQFFAYRAKINTVALFYLLNQKAHANSENHPDPKLILLFAIQVLPKVYQPQYH